MPSKRAPNQKLIAFPIDDELAGLMDQARGTKNRSQFIRDAIARMLGVPIQMGKAPDRVKSERSTLRLNVTINEESKPAVRTVNPTKKQTKKKPKKP